MKKQRYVTHHPDRYQGDRTESAVELTLAIQRIIHKTGFILPIGIFFLLILGTLSALMVQVTIASYTASAIRLESARAEQAAKLGMQAGLYAVYKTKDCLGATFDAVPGLTNFKIAWTCDCTYFFENKKRKKICQIISTACSLRPKECPTKDNPTIQDPRYVERQQVRLVEWDG